MPNILLLKTYTEIEGGTTVPSLGLMYLASIARNRYEDCRIKILDLDLYRQRVDERIDEIKSFAPDIVGITGMSYETATIHKTAAFLKSHFPESVLMVGGPYASASPARCVQDPNIDFAVIGEGDDTFPELLERIFSKGNDYRDVEGIAFFSGGEVVITPRRALRQDVDSIPFPAWDLIDLEAYFSVERWHYIHVSKRFMPIYTSRGCPYQCTYCHHIFGKVFRSRSPENVYEEIKILYDRLGIREFQVADDIFNIDVKRAMAICELIIQGGRKIHLSFPNGVRGDVMTEELLRKLKQAGTYKMAYAVETATPRLQKLIKKNINLEKLMATIAMTDQMGILCHGFFMLGFPTETREEIMNTVRFALASKLHFAGFFFLNPFEGTEISEWILKLNPDLQGLDSHDFFSAECQLSEVPKAEMEEIHRELYRKFYRNPRRIFRTLCLLPQKRQILTLFGVWIHKTLRQPKSEKIPRKTSSADEVAVSSCR